jgi:CheY-like chemotaxis protein
VLVVDGNPERAAAVAAGLRRGPFGATVEVALTAREAHDRLAREPAPGAVVIETDLPDADGLEVARHVRADIRLEGAIVIVFASIEARADEAVDVRCDAYVHEAHPQLRAALAAVALLRLAG